MNKLLIAMMCMIGAVSDTRAESCSDILSHGVFEQTRLEQDSTFQDAWRKYQCSTELSNSGDARSLGIGIGVPVYGVPIELTTSFTKQHRNEWRKSHCSDEERNTASSDSLAVMYSRASPEVVGAWKACMIERENTRGARCELSGDTTTAIVRYSYIPHNAFDAQTSATVKSVAVAGMTCTTLPQVGDAIGPQESIQVCTRDHDARGTAPAVFSLNLEDKGACYATLEGTLPPVAPCAEYSGETVFDGDTTINAKRVCLKEGAVLRVLNGGNLTITADELVTEGKGASIIAIGAQGAKGPRGEAGNGGGTWRAHTDGDYHSANGDCSRSGHQDRGKRGGQGGQGGAGGRIVVRAVLKGVLVHDVSGGSGGPGGDPGQSLTHLRPDGRAPWTCPDDGVGPTGARGPEGTYLYEPQNAGYLE